MPSGKKISKLYILITASFFSVAGCKKLVEVNSPATQITSDNVYNLDATAIAVLNGIYSRMSLNNYSGSSASIPTISMWAGLSADELTLWSSTTSASQKAYYKNTLIATIGASAGSEFWDNIYPFIYRCNTAIEGLSKSTSLTTTVKQQLIGEAKFLRAFYYFYLVNLYGDIPLALTTDYKVNALLGRNSKQEVYDQIISDLNDAKERLADGYLKADLGSLYSPASAERIRPSKAAATALLARIYLYKGEWVSAESQATVIINNATVYDTVPLNNVFLKNTKEAILQLQPVTTGAITNTAEGVFFNLSLAPAGLNSSHPVYLSPSLLNSFEPGDRRKLNGNWVNVFTNTSGTYYYPYKYKVSANGAPVSEYTMLLRVGEQFLIRAEARAQNGDISGAKADLNVIRKRAGLPNTTANDQPSILTAIQQERRVELFTELGQRWLDLKRTGNVDSVMSVEATVKGTTWQSYQQLYPISTNDILKNINLEQTPEYK